MNDNKKYFILIIGFFSILLFASLTYRVNFPFEGTWVIVNPELEEYHIHDTIVFNKDNTFTSTIVKGTINVGKWRRKTFKKNELKLKSCLHSQDNIYKCRKFEWVWELIEITDKKTIRIIQKSNDENIELIYKREK